MIKVKAITVFLTVGIGFHLSFAYDVIETCKVVKNGTFIADPSNSCNGWAYCVNGEVYNRGKCDSGRNFNIRTGFCDYAWNVDCQLDLTTMCNGLDKVFKPHPFDCSQYCYCSNGKTFCQNCPKNQNFNDETLECVWKDDIENNHCAGESPCQLVPNNQFVRNEKNCSKYYRCANNRHFEGECGAGQNFNYLQGRCDLEKDYSCSTGNDGKHQPTPKSETCSSPPENHSENQLFYVKDGVTCRGYFICKNKDDPEPSWNQCRKNTHFDFVKQKCIDSFDTKCEFDRCDGQSQSVQFATILNTNCKKFYLCQNGTKMEDSGMECTNAKYSYFDEIAQGCVPEQPEQEICK